MIDAVYVSQRGIISGFRRRYSGTHSYGRVAPATLIRDFSCPCDTGISCIIVLWI